MRVRTGMVFAALLLTAAGCGAEPARAGCVDGGEVTVTAADNGTAVLVSAVRSRPEPAEPGSVNCLAMVAWQVTAVVR